MNWLASCGLAVLHALHIVWTCLMALLYYPFAANPQQLQTHRSKVPTNLALVLASTQEEPSEEEKDAIIDSVVSAVRWSKVVGIKGLSVYDRHGLVTKYATQIKAALYYDAGHEHGDSECSSDDTDVEYPPTPPLTDLTDSRPVTPENWFSPPSTVTINLDSDATHSLISSFKSKRGAKGLRSRQSSRKPASMTLSLVSYEASKPFLASVARTFTASRKTAVKTSVRKSEDFGISVQSVDKIVGESLQLIPPDLMIVHSIDQYSFSCPPLELYGFPPWIIRLTEIYYDERPSLSRAWQSRGNKRNFVALTEEDFRRALDSYAFAEMRLGK